MCEHINNIKAVIYCIGKQTLKLYGYYDSVWVTEAV